MKSHIIGIGGVFLRANDKKKSLDWYGDRLGIPFNDSGGHDFFWRQPDEPDVLHRTVFGFVDAASEYFEGPVMVNYVVRDLDGLLSKLRESGTTEARPGEEYSYGRFAWVRDPEGRWIELWEPVPGAPENLPPTG